MNNAGYKRWTETEWWTEGYERLWTTSELRAQEQPTDPTSTAEPKASTSSPNGRESAKAAQNTVVYLTADSEEELTGLNPDETYIIGGICDHNRYKVVKWRIFRKMR